jgi:hypothetical protein
MSRGNGDGGGSVLDGPGKGRCSRLSGIGLTGGEGSVGGSGGLGGGLGGTCGRKGGRGGGRRGLGGSGLGGSGLGGSGLGGSGLGGSGLGGSGLGGSGLGGLGCLPLGEGGGGGIAASFGGPSKGGASGGGVASATACSITRTMTGRSICRHRGARALWPRRCAIATGLPAVTRLTSCRGFAQLAIACQKRAPGGVHDSDGGQGSPGQKREDGQPRAANSGGRSPRTRSRGTATPSSWPTHPITTSAAASERGGRLLGRVHRGEPSALFQVALRRLCDVQVRVP